MNGYIAGAGRLLMLVSVMIFFSVAGVASSGNRLESPEQFLGFRVGSDRKLVRWEKIVEYLEKVDAASDRVRLRDLGRSTGGNRFVLVEISSPDTIANLDHYKDLERKLYYQGGSPTEAERDEILQKGKAVVLVTCNLHSTEIGSSQMVLELVHRLATEDSPAVKNILDNVIFLLVPSLNPDGQIMVTDWYNRNVGTPYEASPLPWLYHPYVGHDNNRDLYNFSQKESRLAADLLWRDWLPSVWLDEHQMGSDGPRIFVMPSTDPINPNVHRLVYRLNTLFGQAQATALEHESRPGVIQDYSFTSFWPGAMAWTGWWHNQVGLLTEVASARIASPIEQRLADPSKPSPPRQLTPEERQAERRRILENPDEPLPAPADTTARASYPRPWQGGRWTLRDIVDYELTATFALLESAATQREYLLRQIYEINRSTVEAGAKGDLGTNGKAYAILIPDTQHPEPAELVDRLLTAGVEVYRAGSEFESEGKKYQAGTFVIPFNQVFARYAKDLLEKQTYPEVRRHPSAPAEPPYDVSAWSLGLQFGVETDFVSKPLPDNLKLSRVEATPKLPVEIATSSGGLSFEYSGADSALLINRLLKSGKRVTITTSRQSGRTITRANVTGATASFLAGIAAEFDIHEKKQPAQAGLPQNTVDRKEIIAPRIGLYQPWTANMDEGWTRWVLEHYGFEYRSLHNADIQSGKLRGSFDVIILPDQEPKEILEGHNFKSIRPEYRGGIGESGFRAIREFISEGGTVIALGSSSRLLIDRLPIPVRDLKKSLSREQHFAPGTIVRIQVDSSHPLGRGTASETYGFYVNSPIFQIVEGFDSQRATVVARYPNSDVAASGWLRGEEAMAGRAAVVAIDANPGRVVLFGLRPQHRAQTLATLPLFVNALYWSVEGDRP